jgi:uncharacterized membrane protein YdjX (TVP38/TMEM64 family)
MPGPGRRAEEPIEGHPGLAGVVVTAAAVLVVGLMVAAIPALREAAGNAISGDTEALRANLEGAAGVLTLLVLAARHSIVFYPAEIVNAAAGFVWGFWLGLALVMIGWLLNALISWEIGRRAARPLLYRAFGERRFLRYQAVVERGGAFLLLSMRVIPIVPFSLFTIVAGAAHVPLGRLMWTTAVGYLPLTALFVYLGTQLEELSPTDPILLVGGGAIVILIYLGHRLRGRLLGEEEAGSGDRAGTN